MPTASLSYCTWRRFGHLFGMMALLAPMTIESDAELSDEEGSDEEFGLEAYDLSLIHI